MWRISSRGSVCSLSAPASRKRKPAAAPEAAPRARPKSRAQMLLDFGQRSLGKKVECPLCSLLYCLGDPDDEAAHARHCAPWERGVAFPAPWRAERIVSEASLHPTDQHGDAGRIVEVRAGDPAFMLAKAAEVHAVVCKELGCPGEALASDTARTYLLVRDKRVVGCLVADVAPDGMCFELQPPRDCTAVPEVVVAAAAATSATAAAATGAPAPAAALPAVGAAAPAPAPAAPAVPGSPPAVAPFEDGGEERFIAVKCGGDHFPRSSGCGSESSEPIGLHGSPVAPGPVASAPAGSVASAPAASSPASEGAAAAAAVPARGHRGGHRGGSGGGSGGALVSGGLEASGRGIAARDRGAPLLLGVRAVWVHGSARRMRVATRLLDGARRAFLFGAVVPLGAVAFTPPTAQGHAFAAAYVGTGRLLLFNP